MIIKIKQLLFTLFISLSTFLLIPFTILGNINSSENNEQIKRVLIGHKMQVHAVCFSNDGRYLASAGGDKKIIIWDVISGKEIQKLKGHSGHVQSVSFSPDGKYLVSGGYDDSSIKIWDLNTGKAIKTLKKHRGIVRVKFSPDGKYFVSGSSDCTFKIWDFDTKKLIKTIEGFKKAVNALDFSSDGSLLAIGLGSEIKIFDFNSYKEICLLVAQSNVLCIDFSPDNKYIAAGLGNDTIELWDINSKKSIMSFFKSAITGSIHSICFSPKGNYLISGNRYGIITVWETSSGKFLKLFSNHDDLISSVVINVDGTYLATGSWDESIKLWDFNKIIPKEIEIPREIIKYSYYDFKEVPEQIIAKEKVKISLRVIRFYDLEDFPELFSFQIDDIMKYFSEPMLREVYPIAKDGKCWEHPFSIPYGEDHLQIFKVKIQNETNHIIRLKDSRVFLRKYQAEPLQAFYEVQELINEADKYEKATNNYLYDKEKGSALAPYIPNGFFKAFVNYKLKYFSLINDVNKEILPGLTSDGLLIFPSIEITDQPITISFYDIITKTDEAGKPTERSQYDFYLVRKDVDLLYDNEKGLCKLIQPK